MKLNKINMENVIMPTKKQRKDKKQLDSFAGAALRAILLDTLNEANSNKTDMLKAVEEMAANCYFIAEIMLKESEKHSYEEAK